MLFAGKNNKKKNKDLEKKLHAITPEIRDWVLKRYLRFCQDQHAFKFLCYRKKVIEMNFSKAYKLGFKIRVGMRKKNHYTLRHPVTEVL